MATMITTECINCGACEPECPNTAIYQGGVEWQAPDGAMHAAHLERHLLHRPREVHRVRRLPRSRGVRGGVPGRLLRAQPGDPRDARGAAGARADAASRARRSPTTRRRASRRRERRARPSRAGRRGAAAARRPPGRGPRPRRSPPRPCRPPRLPPVSRSPRPRTGRCRSTASAATATTRCRSRTTAPASSSAARTASAPTVPTLSMVRGVARGDRSASTTSGRRVRALPREAPARARAVRGAPAQELARFEAGAARLAVRERAPGAPTKRRAVLLVLIGHRARAAVRQRLYDYLLERPDGRGGRRAARARVHAAGPRSRVRASGSSALLLGPTRASRSIAGARRWRARAHDAAGAAARRERVRRRRPRDDGRRRRATGGITEIGAVRVAAGGCTTRSRRS